MALIEAPPKIPGVYDTPLIDSWADLLDLANDYGFERDRWFFRGLASVTWRLQTSFERAKEGGGTQPAWKYEAVMLREFTRRAHHYVSDLPKVSDLLEWFALMRHYGAPSRLLDCTYSLYVAAYFALHSATVKTGVAAIWAINTSWLKELYRTTFPADAKRRGRDFRFKRDFKKRFLSRTNPRTFVAPANPFRMNQRLSAQQGVFLCPGDIQKSFMENLLPPGTKAAKDQVVRVLLNPTMKTEALRDLRRMNVTSVTLFPDLSGLAMSLGDWFHFPLHFTPRDLDLAIEGDWPVDRF